MKSKPQNSEKYILHSNHLDKRSLSQQKLPTGNRGTLGGGRPRHRPGRPSPPPTPAHPRTRAHWDFGQAIPSLQSWKQSEFN